MNWFDIYHKNVNEEGPLEYVSKKIKEKRKLIENVVRNTPEGGRILEAGCGTATISIYLSNLGYHVTALDSSHEMLELAESLSKAFRAKPNFVIGDIRELKKTLGGRFDTSFSSGVLEHFSDKDIKEILMQQIACCNRVIFSVPSTFFRDDEKVYGDERFLKLDQWKKLIGESGGELVGEFQFSYKGKSLLKDLNILRRSITSGIKPYIGFIIRQLEIS